MHVDHLEFSVLHRTCFSKGLPHRLTDTQPGTKGLILSEGMA